MYNIYTGDKINLSIYTRTKLQPVSLVLPAKWQQQFQNVRAVYSEYYTTFCLWEVFGKIQKKSMKRKTSLHPDKASYHISSHISSNLIFRIQNPPYSPDLTLYDLLFPHKNKLRSQRKAVDEFKMHILDLPNRNGKISLFPKNFSETLFSSAKTIFYTFLFGF